MTFQRLTKRRKGLNSRALIMVASVGCLFTTFQLAVSFLPQEPLYSSRILRQSTGVTKTFLSSTAECETDGATVVESSSLSQQTWLNKGLLLSSFTDGLKTNPPALDWLMNALVETLWSEEQETTQAALKESNLASPCNGPDPVLLGQLEDTDSAVEGMQQQSSSDWKKQLAQLCETKRARTGENQAIDLRVLYIPTAMYALRPGSTSTPGKQRGRNRADGKKRRNEILRMLEGQLQDFLDNSDANSKDSLFTVRTVTMDFDDASVKQPEEVMIGNEKLSTEGAWYPQAGKEAIREWKPHLIYVQGGNTFWLHHCMEKGDWEKDLMDACSYKSESNSNNDDISFSAVYCGVSAGSILAGESMQTACWKEWDDPSVVPGKETYDDWKDTNGLDATGRISWFPHMTEEWLDMTERKTKELLDSTATSDEATLPSSIRLIRDDQAYVIDGRTKSAIEL